MSDFQQTYKNRAAAFRLFIQAQGLPVSQSKFYQDADRLGMVRQDKTIHLADLLAYAKKETKTDPVSGQSLGEADREDRMRQMDEEEKQLKLAKLKRDHAKEEGRLIETGLAERVLSRKILVIYQRIRDQFRRDQEQMLYRLGLEANKASQLMVETMGCVDRAFNEMRDKKTFSAMIREGEDASDE